MYLNGDGMRMIAPKFGFGTVGIFEVGADCVDAVIVGAMSDNTLGAPTIGTPTSSMDFGLEAGNWQGVTLVEPSLKIVSAVRGYPRIRIADGEGRITDAYARTGTEVVTPNGLAIKKFVVTAQNYNGQSTGTGYSAPSLVTDSASHVGTAIQLAAVSNSGFFTSFTIGRGLNNGDTVKMTYFYKMSGTPASGTFRMTRGRNFVAAAGANLTQSTSYASQSFYYTLSGFSAGDTFNVGAFNSAVTDQTLNIAALVVEVVDLGDSQDGSIIRLQDDFLGDVLADQWNGQVGSDPQVVTPAILAGQARGLVRMTTGDDAAADMATNGVQLESALNWQASLGYLIFEARIAISAITNVAVFVGFTDQVAALEMPIQAASSADTLTTNATDAVGVMFDTAMSTDNWWLVGVDSNVDATAQNAGVAPTAGTMETWRIVVASDGRAWFYRNGAVVGTVMSAAVTPSVALTPVIAAFSRGAASRNIDVDYIVIQSPR
jgi:hypothetical protein